MEALPTLSQLNQSHKSPVNKSGVHSLHGFGIRVSVNAGHLLCHDGIADERRTVRLPRVGHGLRRLVCIGSGGFITLEALRWLADQNAAFVMLDCRGKVLVVTGPVHSSDARLRRAQACASHSGVDLTIARELISRKLEGQERVARNNLQDSAAAQIIAEHRLSLAEAHTMDAIRYVESKGATAYWGAWQDIQIVFPKRDLSRVPEHWRKFDTRRSLLTGSPRLAANPVNAMLNYLYALLESEARLALAALGLDPGLGFIHLDTPARDSLACDLMEAARPEVDAFLLDWITRSPLKREWFSERPDGNCRLAVSLAARLSETAPRWGRAVAPMAEWLAQKLWNSPRRNSIREQSLPTRLTQDRKRRSQGGKIQPATRRFPRRENICRDCGKPADPEYKHCGNCRIQQATERMPDVARVGRLTAQGPHAQAKRSTTQLRHGKARRARNPSSQPAWLTEQFYLDKIQPQLAQMSGTAIARAIGTSLAYGSRIRAGTRPHPRHWGALAHLTGSLPKQTI